MNSQNTDDCPRCQGARMVPRLDGARAVAPHGPDSIVCPRCLGAGPVRSSQPERDRIANEVARGTLTLEQVHADLDRLEPVPELTACSTASHDRQCATYQGFCSTVANKRAWRDLKCEIDLEVGECHDCGSTIAFDMAPKSPRITNRPAGVPITPVPERTVCVRCQGSCWVPTGLCWKCESDDRDKEPDPNWLSPQLGSKHYFVAELDRVGAQALSEVFA